MTSDAIGQLRAQRWLAVAAGGDTVRLLPVGDGSVGPDIFVRLADLRAALAVAWVPCAERLPDEDQTVVLAYTQHGERRSCVAWRERGEWLPMDDSIYFVNEHGGDAVPTHWMPIPAPPKE